MNRILVVALILLGLSPAASRGAINYEPFDFVVGGSLAGNSNWSSLNTGTAPQISAGNLQVSGLAAPTGNKVSFVGSNFQEAIAATNSVTSGTVYFSLALQLTSLPTGTGTYSFGLSTGSQNFGAVIFLQNDGTDGFNLGLANRPTATVEYSPIKLSLNATHFLAASYEFVGGSGNDASALWINPAAQTFAGAFAPVPSLTAQGGTDLSAVSQFLLRGSTGSPAGEMDELRIGTSWAAVTPLAIPEPSPVICLLGGMVLLLARRRRH